MASRDGTITGDDERAVRLTLMAAFFMSQRDSVGMSKILEEFYGDITDPDSARKAFSRDRKTLAEVGVFVVESGRRDGEKRWTVDEEASFAGGVELDALDAIALDVACQPIMERADFTQADDLRFALAKIDRTFGDATQAVAASSRTDAKPLAAIRRCMALRHVARIKYRDAKGNVTEREYEPYGLYPERGNAYVVVRKVETGEMRTLRLDRMLVAKEVAANTFEVPHDFCLEDWRRLPFQLGDVAVEGVFVVPDEAREAFERERRGRGELSVDEAGRTTWTIGISNVADAASWAVSCGIVPITPAELVDSFTHVLKGVTDHG